MASCQMGATPYAATTRDSLTTSFAGIYQSIELDTPLRVQGSHAVPVELIAALPKLIY